MTQSDHEPTPASPVDEDVDQAAPEAAEPETESGAEVEVEPEPEPAPDFERQLAERTADLQRLQAEYVNYKRRVDRDREAIRDNSVAAVVTQLLPVLDDIGRARDHGELEGGFKAVADSLEQVTKSFGLEAFGAEGDPFDPLVHEALHMEHSDEVSGPQASKIVQVGYRIGERVLRPARVLVVAPQD